MNMEYSTEEKRYILLYLARGMTPARFNNLIEYYGSASEVLAAAESPEFKDPKLAGSIISSCREEAFDKIENRASEMGVRLICRVSPDYPPRFLDCASPPPIIYTRGDISLLYGGGISIIGSRRCTCYGRSVAASFGRAAALAGIPIISGGAYGIDTDALTAALDAGGRTVAVFGCGIDICYPSSNAQLFDRIAKAGLLISEFPPGTAPQAYNFPRRNRLVSALCDCLAVIEAGEKSGTLSTVRCAQAQGREIACVPGNITSPQSVGCNRLIKQGARCITSPDDLLALVGKTAPKTKRPVIKVTPEESELIKQMRNGEEVSLDELTQRCNNSAGKLAALLTMMELRGIVQRAAGGLYILNNDNIYR